MSDLIPERSEKFEFRKNFVHNIYSVKNWPKIEMSRSIVEKLQNEILNLRVAYLPENEKKLGKCIFY